MSEEIKVTGCEDCPFMVYMCDKDIHICEHPHVYPSWTEIWNKTNVLDNCPLKTESITVTL
jgi:hypothetical protein